MPLDQKNGENVGEFGVGRPAPLTKWSDTRFFHFAASRASEAFRKQGALAPIQFDQSEVLVQEYPTQNVLMFIFARQIAGQERYFIHHFTLEPEVVSDLVNTGKWTRPS